MLALDRNTLEVLGSEDRAHARAPNREKSIVHDRGYGKHLFARGPDPRNVSFPGAPGILHLLFEDQLRVVRPATPQVQRGSERDLVVHQAEHDRGLCLPFHNQSVVPGEFQFRAEMAPGLCARDRARQRGLGDDESRPCTDSPSSHHRAGAEDELILFGKRIKARVHLVHVYSRGKSATSQIGVQPRFVEWFDTVFSFGQVDPKDFSHVPVHFPTLDRYDSVGRRFGLIPTPLR